MTVPQPERFVEEMRRRHIYELGIAYQIGRDRIACGENIDDAAVLDSIAEETKQAASRECHGQVITDHSDTLAGNHLAKVEDMRSTSKKTGAKIQSKVVVMCTVCRQAVAEFGAKERTCGACKQAESSPDDDQPSDSERSTELLLGDVKLLDVLAGRLTGKQKDYFSWLKMHVVEEREYYEIAEMFTLKEVYIRKGCSRIQKALVLLDNERNYHFHTKHPKGVPPELAEIAELISLEKDQSALDEADRRLEELRAQDSKYEKNSYLLIEKGRVLRRRGDFAGAIQTLYSALVYAKPGSPESARAWNVLGYVYDQLGRIEEARNCWRHALHADATHYRAHLNLLADSSLRGGKEAADKNRSKNGQADKDCRYHLDKLGELLRPGRLSEDEQNDVLDAFERSESTDDPEFRHVRSQVYWKDSYVRKCLRKRAKDRAEAAKANKAAPAIIASVIAGIAIFFASLLCVPSNPKGERDAAVALKGERQGATTLALKGERRIETDDDAALKGERLALKGERATADDNALRGESKT